MKWSVLTKWFSTREIIWLIAAMNITGKRPTLYNYASMRNVCMKQTSCSFISSSTNYRLIIISKKMRLFWKEQNIFPQLNNKYKILQHISVLFSQFKKKWHLTHFDWRKSFRLNVAVDVIINMFTSQQPCRLSGYLPCV